MTFEERWRAELDMSLATFAALAAREEGVDFTHGYLAAGVLWPIRQAVRQRHDEAIDRLTDLAPAAYPELRQLIDRWPEEERAAAQALAAAAAGSQKLHKGLDALIAHFDAATAFSHHLQPHVVSEGGQRIDIDEIKAALVNVGGIMNIQSLAIHSQQAVPKLDEDYAGAYIAARVDEHIARYTALPFVGRSGEQKVLDDVMAKGGRLVVTAPAGFGKSALLAHWLRQQQNVFVAYHFFSDRFDDGRSIQKGLHSIVRQLCNYYVLGKEKLPRADASIDGLRAVLVGLLQDHGTQPDRPLVVLIDALDEAESPFTPPFPGALPDGVSLIVSGRAEENETPPHLAGWVDDAQRLHLERLPLPAVAAWLHEAGGGALAHWAQQAEFVREVNQKTQGFPLYLSFLIEDLLGAVEVGADPAAVLQGTPTGFSSYIRQQFQKLAKTARQEQQIADLFVLLAVAKGPLLEQEVAALTNLSEWDLADLPHEVTRWFNVVPLERGSLSGTRTFAFAHALLAEEFKQLLNNRAQTIEEQLLEWCARWPEHREQYALQYYPLHLIGSRHEQLYALACNESYLHLQSELEANLPLRTLQAALETAAARDAAKETAGFLLGHVRWVQQTVTRESPLSAARNGDPERAFQLADLYPAKDRVLWYLIIHWELIDVGRSSTAATVLERLLQADLPALTREDWQNEIAIIIISYLIAKEPAGMVAPTVTTFMQYFIDNRTLHILVNELAQHRLFSAAWQISYSILDDFQRAWALRSIAAAEAQGGHINIALKIASQIEDDQQRAWALGAIAVAEAQGGHINTALKTTAQIEDDQQRARALGRIAAAQVQAGDIDAARYTFAQALETATQIEDDQQRAWARQAIATAQAQAGDVDVALETAALIEDDLYRAWALQGIATTQAQADRLDAALETAALIENTWQRAWVVGEIAVALAQAGHLDAALDTVALIEEYDLDRAHALRGIAVAQARDGDLDAARDTLAQALQTTVQIDYDWYRAEALEGIAAAQAQGGDLDAALDTVALIESDLYQAEALREIAVAQAQAGHLDAALETAAQIDYDWYRAEALEGIAVAQAQAGHLDAACHTFAKALEIAAQIEDDWHQAKVVGDIATAQAQASDLNAALETAAHIEDDWQRAEALGRIAAAQVQDGDVDVIHYTFAQALETVAQIENDQQRARALGRIAAAQVQAGDIDAARYTFAQALETATQIEDDWQQAWAMEGIAAAQAQAGDVDAALDTVALIEYDRQRAEALREIAVAQVQAGDGRDAIATSMLIVAEQNLYLPEIAEALAKAGDKESFHRLLIPCANYPDAAYKMCGSLAKLYPEQAKAIAAVVIGDTDENAAS